MFNTSDYNEEMSADLEEAGSPPELCQYRGKTFLNKLINKNGVISLQFGQDDYDQPAMVINQASSFLTKC